MVRFQCVTRVKNKKLSISIRDFCIQVFVLKFFFKKNSKHILTQTRHISSALGNHVEPGPLVSTRHHVAQGADHSPQKSRYFVVFVSVQSLI